MEKAYAFHSSFFDNDYTADDFFALSSFQDKISGRGFSFTGGKGLTELLNELEVRSDAYNCYCISGNKRINLLKNYIASSSNGWIGFNKNNDFFNELPEKKCIERIPFFFPGTAYNLNFVLKQDNPRGKE